MTNTKSTKRALLSSVLALVVCIAMLVGSTFAWFTDNASTAVNQIVAGNLDIVLEMWDANAQGGQGDWVDAEGLTLGWVAKDGRAQDKILWEPGCTYELPALRVRNEGNLALKYTLIINGVIGDAGLLKVIDFTANDQPISNFNGKLYAKGETDDTSDAIVIKGHMQETAGNEYMNATLSGISVAVFATQLNYENDSYGPDYDKLATYSAGSTSELEDLLKLGGKIILEKDITVDKSLTVPAGVTAVVDLNGKTLTGATSSVNVFVNEGELTIIGSGEITTRNLLNRPGAKLVIDGDFTIIGGAPTAGSAIWNEGDAVVNNVTIEQINTSNYAIKNADANATLTVNNATVVSKHGAIANDAGTMTINGGTYDVTGFSTDHTVYAPNGGVTINGGTFKLSQVNASAIGSTVIDGAVAINGGVFDSVDGAFAYNGQTGLVVKGGTFMNKATTVYGGEFAQFVADGYVATKNADGTYTVIKTIATTNELKNALTKGGNIVLGDDIDLTGTLMAKKDVVIDLNGNELTAPASGALFQSQSGYNPDIIITSSKSGAKINAGGNAVLLGYGSTEFYNVEINVGEIKSSNYTTFKVYGDLTLGEGTVVNVDYLGTSLISNTGANAIVIDGAKINIGTFKTNAGSIISLSKGATLALKNTEVKVGLDTTYISYFISNADGATITGCTFDVKDKNNVEYDIVFKPDASVGAKYAWVQK